jgi:hypothetical protein
VVHQSSKQLSGTATSSNKGDALAGAGSRAANGASRIATESQRLCPLKGRFAARPKSSHRPTCRAAARSKVERGEEPKRVVGELDLFKAEGSPELQHLVEGNAENEFDVRLCGLIEQRRQNQSNASGSVAKR